MPSQQISTTYLSTDAALQLYLRFESNWNDSSTNAYNLTAVNTPTFVAGQFGNAGDFVAASSQEANRAAASMANAIISTTQSWIFWVKFSSFSGNNYIMGRSTGGAWFMYGGSGGQVAWNSGLSVDHNVTVPTTGVWHQVCFVYNSSAQTISSYLNGVIVQNGVSVTGSVSGAGTNYAVGRIGDYAGYGTFSIDDLAMFSRVIESGEVAGLYNGTMGTTTSTSSSTSSSTTTTSTSTTTTSTSTTTTSTSTTTTSTSTTTTSTSTTTTSTSTTTTSTSTSSSTTTTTSTSTSSSTTTTSTSTSTTTTTSTSTTFPLFFSVEKIVQDLLVENI